MLNVESRQSVGVVEMKVSAITSQLPLAPSGLDSMQKQGHPGFSRILEKTLLSVDALQEEADQLTEAFIGGHASVEIHDVILAAEKARLALDLTVSIRNKLVEAYQEIMRMQI